MRMETWNDRGHGGDPDWRGKDGPLHVTRGPRDNPLHDAFVKAGAQAGYPVTSDYNGEQQEGFGPMEMTVYKGRRWSAANAYLKPALKRENCEMIRAFARKVVIEDGRAVGVEIERGGKVEVIRANAEVILAASSLNSPKMLMLSGIGPAKHLAEHGIDVVADRPGVGQNLQDHLEFYFQFACKQPITLFKYWNLFGKGLVGAQWMFTKTGLGASNQFESAAFIRSDKGVDYPDIQYHFLPIAVRYDGTGRGRGARLPGPRRPDALPLAGARSRWRRAIRRTRRTSCSTTCRPSRTGSTSANASASRARSLPSPRSKPFGASTRSSRVQTCKPTTNSTASSAKHVESAYHPCGTCKMGAADDPMSVVDPECRVIGVDGLRVADSSIFPRITNGNLNGPSIMTGEKASDHILGRRLPSSNAEPWFNPNWQEAQR